MARVSIAASVSFDMIWGDGLRPTGGYRGLCINTYRFW